MFATDNEKANSEYRRKIQSTLNQYITYEEHVDTCVKLVTERLKELSHAGGIVDLGWWMLCYAFDVNGMITVSRSEMRFLPLRD